MLLDQDSPPKEELSLHSPPPFMFHLGKTIHPIQETRKVWNYPDITRYYPNMDYHRSCRFNPFVLHVGGISAQNCPPEGTVFVKREARWFEIELINTGSGHILSQDEIVPARPGMVFFHAPGRTVQGTAPYTCDVIVFDAEYSPDREADYRETNLWSRDMEDSTTGQGLLPVDIPPFFQLAAPTPLATIFRRMQALFHQKASVPQLALKQGLFEILLYLGDRLKEPPGRHTVHQERLDRLCRYIEAHPERQFTLNELAEMINLSPNFLCRIFKESTGQTIFQYIHQKKIDTASSLLFETRLSVKAIALEVGIENQSYFHTIFKRLRGMTPSQYRERNSYRV